MNLSALENVMLGAQLQLDRNPLKAALRWPSITRAEAQLRLASAELMRFVGLEAYLDARADSMPYGALKRLEIARALAIKPRILFLDEPAAGLNPTETLAVDALVRKVANSGVTVVWVPSEKVLFSGDLVKADAACYTGDTQLAEWPATLDALAALQPDTLVPGRGPALLGPQRVQEGLAYTRDFVTTLLSSAQEAVAQNMSLNQAMAHCRLAMDPKFGHVFIYEHCLPFDVTRAVDEASGIKHPRIWTAERDKAMWQALQAVA